MATISFLIPDGQANRMTLTQMLDNFCTFHNYDANKLVGETKLNFFRRWTIQWWMFAARGPAVATAQAAVTIVEPPDIPV